ncbi:hypothetical protein [Mycetocola spongiae]|uniref:hypothetical protein n=1 Tax=Mycetocola spongiae TaxID=2859226 RepID=UPI001CF5E86E|nr:hypothetical protein [Mycetocola spongiae]UCR89933.1 hypothetical protein KXZ72_04490 [Mycetocola spongiae]
MSSTKIVIVPDDDGNELAPRSIVNDPVVLTRSAQSILDAYTAVMPKVDVSALIPAFDFASVMPQIDANVLASIANAQGVLPKIDALVPALNITSALSELSLQAIMPKTAISEILAAQQSLFASMPDYSHVLGGITKDWFAAIQPQVDLTSLMRPITEMLRSIDWDAVSRRQQVPDNWPDDIDEKLPTLMELVNQDGIPAAWVPRADVLNALLAASPGNQRSEVLVLRRAEILEDCSRWVDDLSDPVLEPVLPIAREALEACRMGLWKVGAISAVQVTHSIVESLRWVSDRQRVVKHHLLKMDTPYPMLLEQATRAPLVLFYDDWNPQSGKPRPSHLTRHVVSHRLGEDQVNERNCVVAVMLMASLLVTVYQLDLGQREKAA